MILSDVGTLTTRTQPFTDAVVGVRFLTGWNATIVVDYFHRGDGYSGPELMKFFDLVERASDSLAISGNEAPMLLARRAAEAGYGRMNPMRNYIYGRFSQPDAFGFLYLSIGAGAIVNPADESFSFLPEVQYKAAGNLELRAIANLQRGEALTEFAEKRAKLRLELRARYYF